MKTLSITDERIKLMVADILTQMADDEFKPDYVVGITRGGLVPAQMISRRLDIPMETLRVSLRGENERTETNCWMAEDVVGYPKGHNLKKILIVDDINDTGATLHWIKNDWEKAVPAPWEKVWGENVKIATLVNNEASNFVPSYYSLSINKAVDNIWVEFPWECWWK